jgi:hypothetical protein
MKIGITGASGQLGTALLRHALARTSAANIVAITRNPGKLEQFSQQGVEVRAGDFRQPSALDAAFRDIERLVIIPTTELQPGVRIQQHRAAIEAAAGNGVQHLIYISTVSSRPDPNNSLFDSHFATEQALIASGVDWTILRMSVYTDALLDAAKRAAASGSYAAVPGAPAAYVHTRSCLDHVSRNWPGIGHPTGNCGCYSESYWQTNCIPGNLGRAVACRAGSGRAPAGHSRHDPWFSGSSPCRRLRSGHRRRSAALWQAG